MTQEKRCKKRISSSPFSQRLRRLRAGLAGPGTKIVMVDTPTALLADVEVERLFRRLVKDIGLIRAKDLLARMEAERD